MALRLYKVGGKNLGYRTSHQYALLKLFFNFFHFFNNHFIYFKPFHWHNYFPSFQSYIHCAYPITFIQTSCINTVVKTFHSLTVTHYLLAPLLPFFSLCCSLAFYISRILSR
ncbi:hypothetical protein BDZ97DRAFT_1834809 [Flammula alnicola]|nr:hypothetical protein BDZ97DRAFT_1834809 [Flammula alnicola]